jgi:hypothetical protein
MSLVVARQDGTQLAIVSDTKLTYPYHEVKSLKTRPEEGIIKTVILSDNQCISFAGDMDSAEAAFKEIGYTGTDEQIIEVLTRYHKQSSYKTEFLYCTGSPLSIYKFKDNDCRAVHSCWLGDKAAFEVFQSFIQGTPPKKDKEKHKKHIPKSKKNPAPTPRIEILNFNVSITASITSPYLSKMLAAMDHVIDSGKIDSVGGFKVQALYNEKFSYTRYNDLSRNNIAFEGFGPRHLGHGDAQEGAYSVHFYDGSPDSRTIAIHIRQAELGIVYRRIDGGLLKPQLYNKHDEIDFVDNVLSKFQIPVKILTQDRESKYFNQGDESFKKRDYLKAASSFLKGLNAAKGEKKAVFLYHLGLTQWNMNDRSAAIMSFNEAIRINPAIRSRIDASFASVRPK